MSGQQKPRGLQLRLEPNPASGINEHLAGASPLKPELLRDVDLLVVRELTGGIYFGKKTRDATVATDLCTYHAHEVERIVRVAARLAAQNAARAP